jgi:putative salt-induced outer membrane protein YdiY
MAHLLDARRTSESRGAAALAALVFSAVLWCLAGAVTARADEVYLTNGDRLTGDIVKMEEGTVTLRTDYGGTVSIDWTRVHRVHADRPLTVQRRETREENSWTDFLYRERPTVSATDLGAGAAIPLDDVVAINPPPPIQYHGTITAGGNNTQGNTNTTAINASTRWTIRADRHRVLLEGKYNYGEVGRRVTVRNSLGSAKYDFFLTPKVFVDASTLFEKDTFQSLILRTTSGAGMGYQFLDTKRHTLAAALGFAYVHENYTNQDITQAPSVRWGVRWEYALIPDRIALFHKHEGYRDFGSRNATRVLAGQGVRITLSDKLYVNFEYDFRYNGAPAPGRERTDEAFIIGIGYELGR